MPRGSGCSGRPHSCPQSPGCPQAEVAERLLDRLEDCRRTFPTAAVLGGAAEAVVTRMCGGRAGIERVVLLDSSAAMLERCKQQVVLVLQHDTSPSHAVEI